MTGSSIESDQYCWRADELRRTPAAIRFLSLEPLLGPLNSDDARGGVLGRSTVAALDALVDHVEAQASNPSARM